uniref:Cell division protein FtsK n=1 Tax=Schlesneria paludicola TaxID=360056 RepID=A0A7C4LJT5_9PLAN
MGEGGFEVYLDDEQRWTDEVLRLVAERTATETELTARQRAELAEEERSYAEVVAQVTAAYEAEAAALTQQLASRRDEATERWNADWTARETTLRTTLAEIEHRYQTEFEAARSKRDETLWLVSSVLDESSGESPLQQWQRLRSQIEGTQARLESLTAEVDTLRDQALAWLGRCRMSTDVPPIPAPALTDHLPQLADTCAEAVAEAHRPAAALRRAWLPRLFSGFWPLLAFLVVAASVAAPLWLLLDPGQFHSTAQRHDPGWMALLAACGGGVSLVLLVFVHVFANQTANRHLYDLLVQSRLAHAASSRWQRLAREELRRVEADYEHRHHLRQQQRQQAVVRAEEEFANVSAELASRRDAAVQECQTRYHQQRLQAEAARRQEVQSLERAEQAAWSDWQQRRHRDLQQLAAEHSQRLAAAAARHRQEWDHARDDWERRLRELSATAAAWETAVRRHDLDWEQGLHQPSAADTEPAPIPLGWLSIRVDVPQEFSAPSAAPPPSAGSSPPSAPLAWSLPVVLDPGRQSGVLVRTDSPHTRRAAAEFLQTVMLRLLLALPPGKVRFTILDPVGLGEGFAAFMHLADVDELLVTHRIWTEPLDIEQRLGELTEHMETVLQMFLRNEFATLADYNRQAAEVAEPYRVLVAANLPAQMTDIALRRLWSIVTGGARCGVIPLLSIDTTQPWPKAFPLADLEHCCVTLERAPAADASPRFRIARPALRDWPLCLPSPPPPALFGELVKRAARRAADVRRVEVPFWRIAPSDDAIWTRNSARGLDIAIGRAGATKTQSVQLGTGTSQHVLIAGKTGSGKSTLMHALITSAALHYAPDQLEFYLVDFKKGVEFQVYARHRLPHARVIAMESDREFGVSVLERLDALLQERSRLFRDAGVADLPAFREAHPHRPLPRILLIIDEFQEFFTEDDQLAQSAALLLDRLVRQGRAFGVHVVLGSQTLAGAYSLARSTLGQIAVRIALQCSETDAHLILSEDNTAARLLTRPGEAIYNDANGLPAGNQLFQVVWLADDERERRLTDLAQRGRAWSLPEPIVFEGHVPVDFRRLPVWTTHPTQPPLTADHPSNGAVPVWLGEAVSLRGTQRLDVAATPGSNLLVVGQDESAALGLLAAAVLSVAHPARQAHAPSVIVLNGSPNERSAACWRELAAALPQIVLGGQHDLEARLQELVAEARRREGQPGPRRWLCLFDLVRFRKLRRKDDDFGFGGFDKSTGSAPPELLAELLRDGPPVGLHVWVWCDSANTAHRWLSRDMQQQFEHRVVFAMNATDSSQLIDSPAASRLGPHRAWLFDGERGTLEKFRPYSPPEPGWLSAHKTGVVSNASSAGGDLGP